MAHLHARGIAFSDCGNTINIRHLILLGLILCTGVSSGIGNLFSQDNSDDSSLVKQTRAGVASGIRKLAPGDWGLMRSEVQNVSNQAKEVLSCIYFDTNRGVQYCRRVWVPAHSRRSVWIPVLIPKDIVNEERQGEFVMGEAFTSLIDQSGDTEIVLRSDGRKLADTSVFSLDTEKPITIQITDHEVDPPVSVNGRTEFDIAGQAFKAMRIANSFSEAVPNLSDRRVPIIPATLDPADQIIVRGNRLADDAPGRAAIRQWVQQGGRLWLMLDTMEEATVQRLLGDSISVQYVDRLSLVEFKNELSGQMLSASNSSSTDTSNIPKQQKHTTPVEFVRTIVDGAEIALHIDGWPSVFKQEFGRGTILFTTIGTRALVSELPNSREINELLGIAFEPRQELRMISQIMFAKHKEPVVSKTTLTPLVQESVGYTVPGRGMILAILSVFCIGLLVVGMVFAKTDRLDRMIWAAPLIALIATIPLIVMGNTSKKSTPATVVQTQFIETTGASDDVFVSGLAGVFNTDSSDRVFTTNSTTIFMPDRTGINGTWRMVWDDLDHCSWENVSMPSGLRLVPMKTTAHAVDPMRTLGTFGPDGFEGSVQSPLTNLRDAVISSSNHVSLAVDLDGTQVAGPVENSLAPGQYIAAGMLNDVQVRHQEVYRKIMDFGLTSGLAQQSKSVSLTDRLDGKTSNATKVLKTKFPAKPSLLVWADPIDLGLDFNPDAEQKGDALVVMPIEFQRPTPKQTIRIPSVFTPYQSVFGGKDGKSMAFDGRTGTWVKQSRGTTATLRFQLPDCVLPFEPTQANLRIKINAAMRKINIKSGRKEAWSDVGEADGDAGILNFKIDQLTALKLDENGGLHVRVQVGDVKFKDGDQEVVKDIDWKIDFIELQVDGKYAPMD